MTGSSSPRRSGFWGLVRSVPGHIWVAAAIVVLALIFVLQNRQDASVHLFNISITAPLWMTLLITLIAGVLVGALARRSRRRQQDPASRMSP